MFLCFVAIVRHDGTMHLLAAVALLPLVLAVPGRTPTSLESLIDQLEVAPERGAGYNRSFFPHWDTHTDGCSTREKVLLAESSSPALVSSKNCTVLSGTWFSLYDGKTTYNPRNLDVDHVVALKEAWDSGAYAWSQTRRRAFANDLSDPDSLVAVSSTSNRAKSDKDPAQWLPRSEDRCRYVYSWVGVKLRWDLSVDPKELAVLRRLAENCRN